MCRTFTPHLPQRLLYLLSHLAVPLYTLYRVPHLGRLLYRLLPIFMSPNARERILNTFDWYSPVYQHYTSTETVVDWFRDAGLTEIETSAQGHASGIKPIRDSRDIASDDATAHAPSVDENDRRVDAYATVMESSR